MLDRDELLGLQLKVLHQICKHLNCVFDKTKDRNKKKLVDLIMTQRQLHTQGAQIAGAALGGKVDVMAMKSWHSKDLGHAMGGDI